VRTTGHHNSSGLLGCSWAHIIGEGKSKSKKEEGNTKEKGEAGKEKEIRKRLINNCTNNTIPPS